MWLVLLLVLLLIVVTLTPDPKFDRYKNPCSRGHDWTEVLQPGLEDEDGRDIVYLYCTKCRKTASEIINEGE
jgi:hypothetical protein